MKKIGKVLSLVMALALTVCLLSATAFASVPTPAVIPNDGIYKITSINTVDQSVASSFADGIKGTVTDAKIYYSNYMGASYQFVSLYNGTVVPTPNADSAMQVMENCLLNKKAYVYGQYSEVVSTGIYHYDFVDNADDLEVRIIPNYNRDADQSYLVDAYPIVNEAQTSLGFLLGSVDEMGTTKYQVMVVDDSVVYYNYTLDQLKDEVENCGLYVYTSYVEPSPDAPTTTAAAPTTTAATSPKTGDSAMTATFIALGVVAVCGLAVVTFSTKKTK